MEKNCEITYIKCEFSALEFYSSLPISAVRHRRVNCVVRRYSDSAEVDVSMYIRHRALGERSGNRNFESITRNNVSESFHVEHTSSHCLKPC